MLSIGEFSQLTRLSQKALRLYDQLDLLAPAHVDDKSGYRWYSEAQIERARQVALLRRLDMPLGEIKSILDLDPSRMGRAVADYWDKVEAAMVQRRSLVHYLQHRHQGDQRAMYNIEVRTIPRRGLFTICRHVHADDAGEFFGTALQQLRTAGPGLGGIDGAPFVVYYGEVSADSDGPVEICRPVDIADGRAVTAEVPGVDVREEPTHDEAYIRLTMSEVAWPALLPAVEALEQWVTVHQRQPLGPPRQVLIADWRTARPDTPACDLAVPLR